MRPNKDKRKKLSESENRHTHELLGAPESSRPNESESLNFHNLLLLFGMGLKSYSAR